MVFAPALFAAAGLEYPTPDCASSTVEGRREEGDPSCASVTQHRQQE